MSVRPSEPVALGTFIDYPADATGLVAPHWLASGGTQVRKVGACKRALIATFEAVIERAVAIANAGDSMTGVTSLISADYATATAPYSAVDLGAWGLAASRALIAAKFKRCAPYDEWGLLIELTWALWAGVSRTIVVGQKSFHLYAWQDGFLEGVDTDGWVVDDVPHMIYLSSTYDLESAPCDRSVAAGQQQVYAPWGSYTGPEYGSRTVSEWLFGVLTAIGRQNVDLGTPGGQDSLANNMMWGMSPFPLGTLAAGHLGNWMAISSGSAQASSVRFSSSAWAVVQTMLANMRYTHLGFSYEARYSRLTTQRTWTRVFGFDDTTLEFSLSDYGYLDDPVTVTDINYLRSGSSIWNSPVSLAVGMTFGVLKGSQDESDLVLAFPPATDVSIDGRDYFMSFDDWQGGAFTVTAERDQTQSITGVTVDCPAPYPAQTFSGYLSELGPVTFVDSKYDGEDYYHSVHQAAGNIDLAVSAGGHATWLLGEVSAPRSFPSPGQAGNVGVASAQWWLAWKFRYPSQPNYPFNDPNPTKYFPSMIVNPQGEAFSMIDDGTYIKSNRAGGLFGSLELAFPGYPWGWDDSEYFEIWSYADALAGYKWNFKAMPVTS